MHDKYQQAREYLAKVVPWPENGEHFVNIHWTEPNQHWTPQSPKSVYKHFWRGKPCTNIAQAIAHIDWLTTNGKAKDVYVCMSGQREKGTKLGNNGNTFDVAVRETANATCLKSLFIDLDAKGTERNSYGSLVEAAKALSDFVGAVGLPKPSLVVCSGSGLHVYWTLACALTVGEWIVWAYALAEATRVHGLKCDTQCTIDAARILRVPNTLNYKSDTPKEVTLKGKNDFDYINERVTLPLEKYKVATPKVTIQQEEERDYELFPVSNRIRSNNGYNELSNGVADIQHTQPPVVLADVLPECKFLEEAVATNGKNLNNALWNFTTLLATWCEDGRGEAHKLASGYPGYTPEETDTLYDRKLEEREEKNLGWVSCRAIQGAGSQSCNACVHLQQEKSPFHFQLFSTPTGANTTVNAGTVSALVGTMPTSVGASLNALALPAGYNRHPQNNLVCQLATEEDGTTKYLPVFEQEVHSPWLQEDPDVLHFTISTDKGKTRRINIPLEDIGGQGMRPTLQGQGLLVGMGVKVQRAAEFLMAWVSMLRDTKDSVRTVPFGWSVKDGTVDGFVYGGSIHTPRGQSQSASSDAVLQRQYTPVGSNNFWGDAAKLITSQGRMDLDAIVASAFAAPLVRFTGQSGMVMSTYSGASGIGKSTALKVAQAVWGHPKKAIQSLDDTQNSVIGKLGKISNLPLYWDELKTEEETTKFVKIAFQTSLGKEKSRMRQDSTLRDPGSWATLIVSCSNDSILDNIMRHSTTTTAGVLRVFEYIVRPTTVDAPGQISSATADALMAKLYDNFGWAGLEYSKFLGANYKQIEVDVVDYRTALEEELQAKREERLWMSLVTCICVGASYANKLGLTTFNEELLKAFMLSEFEKMRGEVSNATVDMTKANNISALLQQFFAEMQAYHMLWTNKIHTIAGKPKPNTINVVKDATKLNGVYVHIGQDDRIMRISSAKLRDWLISKKVSKHIFFKALQNEFGAKQLFATLGSGTPYAGLQEYVLEIDYGGTSSLSRFLE